LGWLKILKGERIQMTKMESVGTLAMLKERIAQQSARRFRISLYQRVRLDGLELKVGEGYIFLNGDVVENRGATEEDIRVVMAAIQKVIGN